MKFVKSLNLLAVALLSAPTALASQSSFEQHLTTVQVALPGYSSRSVAQFRKEMSRLDAALKLAAAQYSQKHDLQRMSCELALSDFRTSKADVIVLGQFNCSIAEGDGSKIKKSEFADLFARIAGRAVFMLDHEPFGSATIGN